MRERLVGVNASILRPIPSLSLRSPPARGMPPKKKSGVVRGKKKDDKKTERNDPTIESNADTDALKKLEEEGINVSDNRYKWASKFLINVNCKGLSKEFMANKSYKPDGATFDECKKHDPFNRYNDILCMDQTRVVLKGRPDSDNYIHASWIETVDKSQKHICTQGPLKETTEHFWHMIYSEKCKVIVMVCDLTEGDNEKCYQYWPMKKDGSDVYGDYTIKIDSVPDKQPHALIKYQILKCEGPDGSILVHHLWMPTWTDHIAPTDPEPVVAMYHTALEKCEKTPIVVHCSAGIGRSGCFAAIDFSYSMVRSDPEMCMTKMLKDLRGQRYQAIQSYIQYNFLHLCILESFVQDKCLPRRGKYTSFLKDYKAMVKKYNEKAAKKKKDEKKQEKSQE